MILSIRTETGLRPGDILQWTLRGQEIKSNFHLIATNQSQSYIAMTNLPALSFSREMLDCSVISGTIPLQTFTLEKLLSADMVSILSSFFLDRFSLNEPKVNQTDYLVKIHFEQKF